MNLNCPHCNQPHDISGQIAGSRLWCPRCTNWLMLAFHRDGAAYFVKVGPPATYPREKR
jgi:hypothetical protein